jgi:hypothetical protein
MAEPVKRLNYFDHQFLKATDFNLEQNYHLSRRRLHTRLYHTPGIAEGLRVSGSIGQGSVSVTAGVAIDGLGQELVLTETATVPISDATPKDDPVYIVIEYGEQQDDEVNAAGVAGNTRWTEKPKLRAITVGTTFDDKMQLIVGRVSRTGGKVSNTNTDAPERKAIGAVGGDMVARSVLLKNDNVEENISPRLSCPKVELSQLERSSFALVKGDLIFQTAGALRTADDTQGLALDSATQLTRLYSKGSIGLRTGGANKDALTILPDGKVGIGTATPNSPLTVQGSEYTYFNVMSKNGVSNLTLGAEPGTCLISTTTAHDLQIRTNGQNPRLIVKSDGKVGIGTVDPKTPLHVEGGDVFCGGPGSGYSIGNRETSGYTMAPTAGERWVLYAAGGSARLWTGNDKLIVGASGNVGIGMEPTNVRLSLNGSLGFNVGTGPMICVWGPGNPGNLTRPVISHSTDYPDWGLAYADVWDEMIFQSAGARVLTVNLGAKNITTHGYLYVSGGKSGFVVDKFANRYGDSLEEGDVVVISDNQAALYYGESNKIPIPEVDIAQQEYDTRVCGIVDQLYVEPGSAAEPRGTDGEVDTIRHRRKRGDKFSLVAPQGFTPEELKALEPDKIGPDQIGLMVTLGAYAHCKVDANIAPIKPGDLLTTSPTKGHAQKVLDPARAAGAIIGKALAPLKKGKGKIPVMVLLQ